MRRLLACVVVTAMGTAFAPTAAGASSANATVEVRDNSFTPRTLEIRSGDSVTWVTHDGGHTVRSDDEVDGVPLFEFPAGSGTLAAGDEHTHAFLEAGEYAYHCEVHPSMTGVVYVDVEPPLQLRRVPQEYPTIAAALDRAPAGTVIEVSPGRYPEAVAVHDGQHDITIRGTGTSPADVVLDGEGTRATGIAAFAPGIRIESLTVRDYTARGVFLSGADRFRVHRVHTIGTGDHGIRAVRARGGGITDSTARGSSIAGMSIVGCDACGALVERVTVEGNGTGVQVTNAGHVLVVDSTASDNGVGISVESSVPTATDAIRSGVPARGAVIGRNTVERSGTGILVRGGWHVAVTGNSVTGGDVGIAVAGAPVPSVAVSVTENLVSAHRSVDLSWDLLGVDVCFSRNPDPAAEGQAPTTDPPHLQALFPCEMETL